MSDYLKQVFKEADEASADVSRMNSDERRELEQRARDRIKGNTAPATPAPPSETPRTDAEFRKTDNHNFGWTFARILERELNALKSPPANPALSQIRSEIERLDGLATKGPQHLAEYSAYLRNNIASLLSIADMLERQRDTLIEASRTENEFVRLVGLEYNETILPEQRVRLEALQKIANEAADIIAPWTTPPALRSIAQMEEGV